MTENDMEQRIIAHLKQCDDFHPAAIGHLAFAVYGEKMAVDKKNEPFYIAKVFDLLSKLESKGVVKNVNLTMSD